MPIHDPDDELDESTSGWLRLALYTTAAILFPLWLLLTATLAQLNPETVVSNEGTEPVVTLVVDWWGASASAFAWVFLAVVVVAPWVIGGLLMLRIRQSASRQGRPSVEGGLPADLPWEVSVESTGEAESAPSEAQAPRSREEQEAPPSREAPSDEPSPVPSEEQEPDDDLDGLFR